MEYLLINIQSDPATREPVVVRTKNPTNWRQVLDITAAVRCKILELISLAKASKPGEMYIPIASLPPDNGDCGCEFYVKNDMYAMLTAKSEPDGRSKFEDLTWDSIHEVVGDELD